MRWFRSHFLLKRTTAKKGGPAATFFGFNKKWEELALFPL